MAQMSPDHSDPGWPSVAARIFVVVLMAVHMTLGMAADPPSYRVAFPKTGKRALDAALRASSQLEALREKGAVEPLALVLRAQGDLPRLKTVLESFGYYQGRIAITIDERPLDDPALPDHIAGLPAGTKAAVIVTAELGPLYRVGRVDIEGDLPEGMREWLGI